MDGGGVAAGAGYRQVNVSLMYLFYFILFLISNHY